MHAEYRKSPFFTPLDLSSIFNADTGLLSGENLGGEILGDRGSIPLGCMIMRGIPFILGMQGKNNILLIKDETVSYIPDKPMENCRFLVFAHSSGIKRSEAGSDGIFYPMKGQPRLGEVAAVYKLEYDDGTVHSVEIKRRFQINEFRVKWGEGAFEAVPSQKPLSVPTNTEACTTGREPEMAEWGRSQTRVESGPSYNGYNLWLYAMENPYPERKIISISFIPADGAVLLSGITACCLESNPLRWESRHKAIVKYPQGIEVIGRCDVEDMEIDLGQVISAQPVLLDYTESWESGYNNKQPVLSRDSVIIEYAAHSSAFFYPERNSETAIPISAMGRADAALNGFVLSHVPEATKHVTLKVKEKNSGKTVPVKIHLHGKSGEYLPPMNRHRIPNRFWYEDYSTDFIHGSHLCTYIDGEAEYKLPLGDIYAEVSKGFEIKPVRKKFVIEENTDEIVVELEHMLPWRREGWVTADTHVHFLSPQTALLEGEAEGINVVNLLASQWGELFTNMGDFDGRTTHGSKESGGTGEFLVRVGTENRQHILGHISLLGYEGRMILPLTTGGPDESAIGDPVEETLCGWAKRCRDRNGVVILPHFPNPRAEGSAAIVSGLVDGVEMTAWSDLYSGISPYSLSDWYRYLNCGYQVPAVAGTDKMTAETAVGTIRTYAKIKDGPFTFDSWKEAIRSGNTFVTYGPLMEFTVEGRDMGSRIEVPKTGATLQVEWEVASVTVPVTKIELVVNGETLQVCSVDPQAGRYSGSFAVKTGQNSWIALRVRGCQTGKQEMIAAHSSAVMVTMPGESCFSAIDAMTILEQIEGAAAYIKTIGTKAEEMVYKELLMTLTSAHRTLHNRMHRNGIYHDHTVADDHHKG